MSLSTTTFGSAVTAGGSQWPLASTTAVQALLQSGGCALFADGEAVTVISLSGSAANVQRGAYGSTVQSHASGATIYIAAPGDLYQNDPSGVAPSSPAVTPWINVITGAVWTASGGVWVLQVPSGSAAITNPVVSGTVTGGASYTAPTLTAPVISAPSGTGFTVTKSGVITELTGDGTYSVTVPIPATAVIHSIRVIPQVLWTAGTSAGLIVGDTADPDGYFTTTNLKATDLLVGEIFDTVSSTLWGGKEGAYLVAATGQRGPTTSNFGPYYVAGSNIVFSVTKVGTGTAGRTYCSVTYSLGESIAQVVA